MEDLERSLLSRARSVKSVIEVGVLKASRGGILVAKLLIVEDEPELGSLLQQHLQGEGHTVQLERDGRDALESCRFTAFDLIILDLMLPGLDGLEVARRIRQPRVPLNNVSFESAGLEHATSATVPILMLTARAEESDRVLGFEVGADDYIAKPFSLREMLARVRACCAVRKSPKKPPPPVLK
jgi:DNA-binding response OmpR family regulator